MKVWRMHFACWITRATDTYSMLHLLLFHCNSGYTNECQCYVIRTYLPVLLLFTPYHIAVRSRVSICAGAPCCRRVAIMRFKVAHESPGGIVRLAATFVKYVWAIKIT
jgi:hypothetical protein